MFIPRSRFELEKLNRFNMSYYWLAYQDIYSDGHFVAPDGIYNFFTLKYIYLVNECHFRKLIFF